MTTTLRIQSDATPFTVSFPTMTSGRSLTIAPMTREEFYVFCQANRDLRIERAANEDVMIMPLAFSDTGNRNFNLAVQLGIWYSKGLAVVFMKSFDALTLKPKEQFTLSRLATPFLSSLHFRANQNLESKHHSLTWT